MSHAKRNVLRHVLALLAQSPNKLDKIPPSIRTELTLRGLYDERLERPTERGYRFIQD